MSTAFGAQNHTGGAVNFRVPADGSFRVPVVENVGGSIMVWLPVWPHEKQYVRWTFLVLLAVCPHGEHDARWTSLVLLTVWLITTTSTSVSTDLDAMILYGNMSFLGTTFEGHFWMQKMERQGCSATVWATR